MKILLEIPINQINQKILEAKQQYASQIYNVEDLDRIPNEEIQFTINDHSFSKFQKTKKDIPEEYIIKTIADLANNETKDNFKQIETKNELISIRNEKLKGHMLRSRAQLIDHNEKPTKYFCALEKHNYVSKIICYLKQEDCNKITDQEKILKETKKSIKIDTNQRKP